MTFRVDGDVNLVFSHIPRTAGRWAVAACKNAGFNVTQCGAQHETLDHALRHNLGERIVFSIKRHPLTWLRSWYASTKMNGWKGWNNVTNCLMAHQADSFEKFLLSYLEVTPGLATSIWKQYLDNRVDYLLKHENVAENMVSMFKELGLNKRDAIMKTPILERYKTKPEEVSHELMERLFVVDQELFLWLKYEAYPLYT